MGLATSAPGGMGQQISPSEIARLSALASREAGINLGPEKADFLMARLSRLSADAGGYSAFCDRLERGGNPEDLRAFLEAITTHTTSFFRESAQYAWLDEAGFRALWDRGVGRARDLVVWSAACSTGQELYSAMLQVKASAKAGLSGLRAKGIGTDLSTSVVSVAKRAVYDSAEISGIPVEQRRQYLLSSKTGDNRHRIGPEIRAMTEWRTANLTKSQTLSGIEADVIFLRNVLIYFDEPTQVTVLRNVLARLRPGGFLLTGHSETASARNLGLGVIRPTIYQKEHA